MRCDACYYVHKTETDEPGNLSPTVTYQCRRDPPMAHPIVLPTPLGAMEVKFISTWPTVQADGWCGAWEKQSARAPDAETPPRLVS